MLKKLIKNWQIVLFVVLSLTPILWFVGRGGALINGVDTNFPLNPLIWFTRRFFVWNDVASAGINFASSTAGLFFHLIQVIPSFLGLNLQAVQILSLIFWFGAIVFASYLFSKNVFPENKLSQVIFVTLYTFNTYIFNTWENVKVANLAVVVALPFMLSLFILRQNGNISDKKFIFLTAITSLIASGAGINPAYFIVVITGLVIWGMMSGGKRLLLTMLSVILLVNSFWIVSTGKQLFFSDRRVTELSDIGFTDWLDSLSENTSLLNVFRLQGAWDWYALDDAGSPLYIPYANNYFRRLPFVAFSFILTALSLGGLLIRKRDNRLKIYFGLLVILGVFLGAGSHLPTGAIYNFLSDHMPFFSFFRSPWYLFTPYTVLGLTGLAALLFSSKNKLFKLLAPIVIVGNLVYCYPLVTGKVYRPASSDSFFVKFPEYVFESADWLNSGEAKGRVIGYPGEEIERFKWGYSGIESILNLMSSRETLFLSLNAGDLSQMKLINAFYKAIRNGQVSSAESIAAKLNIQTIFDKNDQRTLWGPLPQAIKEYEKVTFGDWSFYNLPSSVFLPKILVPEKVYFAYPGEDSEELVGVLPGESAFVDSRDSVVAKIPMINDLTGKVILAENSQLAEYKSYLTSSQKQTLAFGEKDLSKVVYKINVVSEGLYTPLLENFYLSEFGIDQEQDLPVLIDGLATTWSASQSGDYLVFNPVRFSEGVHTIQIELISRNLVVSGESVLGLASRDDKELFTPFRIDPFNSLHPYLITFDYKNIYGRRSTFKVEQKSDSVNYKFQSEGPPFSPEQVRFSFYFDPIPAADSYLEIKPTILPVVDDPLGTKIEYSNLGVYPLFTNKLAFISEPNSTFIRPDELTYEKISPVKYKGQIRGGKGNSVIVFSENYSSDWDIKLTDKGGNKVSQEPLHFSINLYANGWYVKDLEGDFDFEIYYKPQRLHNLFLIISFGTLAWATFNYHYNRRRKA